MKYQWVYNQYCCCKDEYEEQYDGPIVYFFPPFRIHPNNITAYIDTLRNHLLLMKENYFSWSGQKLIRFEQ